MTRKKLLLVHLFMWTVYYLVVLAVIDTLFESVTIVGQVQAEVVSEIALILLMFLSVPFYLSYFFWHLNLRRSWSVVWNIGAALSILVLPLFYLSMEDEPLHFVSYLKVLALVLFFSLLGYAFRGFLQGISLKHEKEALENHLLQSELSFLKAQISPHFLFNTLNNIDYLIGIDPDKASQSLISMADIMRYMIYETKESLVPLKKELYYVQNLVALHQLRFKIKPAANTGRVQYKVIGDPADYLLPPMLLLPIIENAFKHQSPKVGATGIFICITIDDAIFRLSSVNSFDEATKKVPSSGFGLQTLKRRLDLLFPDTYTFAAGPAGEQFEVKLELPLNRINRHNETSDRSSGSIQMITI